MDEFVILVCLLPVVFMIHDFEEIIFFKRWISKNRTYLNEKFPKLSKQIFFRFETLSVPAFTLAVAEEFVLLCGITYGSVYFGNYYFWFAAFMGFSVHLIAHIGQWIVIRKYIPSIVTTFLSLPYCIYMLEKILTKQIFSISEILIWTFVGFMIVSGNLIFIHKLAEKFDKKQKT